MPERGWKIIAAEDQFFDFGQIYSGDKCIIDANGEPVALVCFYKGKHEDRDKVIRAAPEMLEALTVAVGWMHTAKALLINNGYDKAQQAIVESELEQIEQLVSGIKGGV